MMWRVSKAYFYRELRELKRSTGHLNIGTRACSRDGVTGAPVTELEYKHAVHVVLDKANLKTD